MVPFELGLQNSKENKDNEMNHETSFTTLQSLVTAAVRSIVRKTARPAVGVAILTGALALTSPAQQVHTAATSSPTSASAPVTVVNTTANPVPVEGTVNVGGTVNVSIADNSATNPLQVHDVDQASRTPYAQTKRLSFNPADRAILGNFDVPAGKKLVIENFSIFGKLPSGMKLVEASINAFQGGEQFGTQHYAPVFTGNTEETFEPGVFIVNSGQTHLEAVAGSGTVTVHLERDHITIISTPFFFDVSITGYLVDAPQ
jgi:hypothetical protein